MIGSGEVAGPFVWSLLWAAVIALAFVPLVMRAYRARSRPRSP